MPPGRYFRTIGPTPLDGKPVAEQRAIADSVRHAVIVKHILDQGGRIVVAGLGEPNAVAELLDDELRFHGLGDGRIEVTVRRTPA